MTTIPSRTRFLIRAGKAWTKHRMTGLQFAVAALLRSVGGLVPYDIGVAVGANGIHRTLQNMRQKGWVTTPGRRYYLTATGRAAFDECDGAFGGGLPDSICEALNSGDGTYRP